MPLPTPSTAKEPGPMTALPGTGGPTFFRTLNLTGWQAAWTPEEASAAYCVAKAAANPALVLGLPAGAAAEAVEAAAKAFGAVEEVFLPRGASFAVVRFADDAHAAKCVAELKAVGGAPVRVQPAAQASAEVAAWRAGLAAAAPAVAAH